MAALTLAVTGMHCDNCKTKVAQALARVDGVYAVDVDLSLGVAHVDSSARTTPDSLINAVKAVGYEATVQGAK